MAAFAALRRFGLALPGVIEHPHMGQPSLRAQGKMFALWSEQTKITIMKLDRAHQDMLFEVSPETFTPCKVGTGMWSYVEIAMLSDNELQGLVIEAWSQVVPKKMRDAFTSSAAASPQRRHRSKPVAAMRTGASAPSPSRTRRR
jgi:hypothetical protein